MAVWRRHPPGTRIRLLLLVTIITVMAGASVAAALRTSTTWDEIVLMAAGARGYRTGSWDLAPEHPPLMQYLYGLPIFLARPNYPADPDVPSWEELEQRVGTRRFVTRYEYARAFFWSVHNDPVRLALLGRIVAILISVGLVVLVHAWTARNFGPDEALIAAVLVAFLPPVLANAAVAYNDTAFAFLLVATIWVMDDAVRLPGTGRGVAVGVCLGLALSVKYTALILFPVGALLIGAEAFSRRKDSAWIRSLVKAACLTSIVTYLLLVVTQRGDLSLIEIRRAIGFTLRFGSGQEANPAWFLGTFHRSLPAWGYPVVLGLRVPLAFQILLVTGLVSGTMALVRRGGARKLIRSPLRGPVIGIVLLTSVIIHSGHFVIRYMLPVLTLLALAVAVAVCRFAPRYRRGVLATTIALILWHTASSLSYYPHFLAYTSELGAGRDRPWRRFADPSIDVGQGLLDLRGWIDERGGGYVYLSTQGSGLPAGYGIKYVPLPSLFELNDDWPEPTAPPEYAVISVTNLYYLLPDNPLARFREIEPDTVIAHVLLAFRATRPVVRAELEPILQGRR